MVRIDQPDLVFRTEDSKYAAVIEDITERHATGQPILIGTTSVEKSEYISGLLKKNGVPHEVLNAKQHEREAAIVARVRVATAHQSNRSMSFFSSLTSLRLQR